MSGPGGAVVGKSPVSDLPSRWIEGWLLPGLMSFMLKKKKKKRKMSGPTDKILPWPWHGPTCVYRKLKPLVNWHIQQLVQTMWNVAIHGRYLSLTEEIPALNQSWGGNHATSNRPYEGHQVPYLVPMLLECAVLQDSLREYYIADALNNLFKTIPETCMVELLREADSYGMNNQTFYMIFPLNHLQTDAICQLQVTHRPRQNNQVWLVCLEKKSSHETRLLV